MSAKRLRVAKYKSFGDKLKMWRGDREIEVIVRLVRKLGVRFDGATLRGWEYGWTSQPDPMRLLALAQVYGVSAGDVLKALAEARDLPLTNDLSRHMDEVKSGSTTTKEPNDTASARRIADLEERLALAEARLGEVQDIASRLVKLAALGSRQEREAARVERKRGTRDRKARG